MAVTGSEFALILAWVLFPPCLLAITVLLVLHRKSAGRRVSRTVAAALVLVAASAFFSLVMMFAGPSGLGSYIGIRDTPVMWAPFAFIAVALALPIAIWWAARGRQS
jgi:hypothetical protein